jgi:hypothetical protein
MSSKEQWKLHNKNGFAWTLKKGGRMSKKNGWVVWQIREHFNGNKKWNPTWAATKNVRTAFRAKAAYPTPLPQRQNSAIMFHKSGFLSNHHRLAVDPSILALDPENARCSISNAPPTTMLIVSLPPSHGVHNTKFPHT